MSHEMVNKEVQDSIILNVFVCSIAANLDLQMKLDLDLVYQRVKSFLWNKGGWAACAWLSLLIHISTWDLGETAQLGSRCPGEAVFPAA